MKVKELFEDKSEDYRIRKIITDYKEGNSKCSFKNMFPMHSVKDGLVHIKKHIKINHCLLDEHGELLIPFGTCGSFEIEAEELSSFKGFPEELTDSNAQYSLRLSGLYKIVKSFEGITKIFKSNVYLAGVEGLNYSRCNKHINQIDGIIIINGDYKGPILSMLYIENLKEVTYGIPMSSPFYKNSETLREACKIVNKHLLLDKDVLECQEELISNGLNEYAKL